MSGFGATCVLQCHSPRKAFPLAMITGGAAVEKDKAGTVRVGVVGPCAPKLHRNHDIPRPYTCGRHCGSYETLTRIRQCQKKHFLGDRR